MNDLYFEKLRSYYLDTKLEEDNTDKIDEMLRLYGLVVELGKISRTKGILDLEDTAKDLDDNNACESYLKKIIMLIVDGTDPENVEEVGMTSVISGDFDSFDSIICLMCLRGALLIQEGQNPYAIGNILRALFPKFVLQIYEARLLENIENRKKIVLQKMEEVKNERDESYYSVPYRTRLSEYIIQASDKEMTNAYWCVKMSEWARASRALSGDAIKRLISILEVDEAEKFIEEAEHNCIRMPFAEEACEHIYKALGE